MKQTLQVQIRQQLTMTPQLQQAIKLLQLSTLDLQQEIRNALDNNPMLEVEDEFPDSQQDTNKSDNIDLQPTAPDAELRTTDQPEWENDIPNELPVDTSWDDIYQSNSTSAGLSAPEDDGRESNDTLPESLHDHLQWQLNLTPMTARDQAIGLTIIDSVNQYGMLSCSIDELYEQLAEELEDLDREEVLAVLHRIQQFDPIGIAAQDLRECLLIQLRCLPKETPHLREANTIVNRHLELLGNRDYKSLMRKMRIREDELADTIRLIQSLNPRPGEQIQQEQTEYIVPDVFVTRQKGRWTVNLNPEIAPKIRINAQYASLIKRADNSTDNTYLKDNLQEAKWFLNSLQSRNETLLKVATCIVEKQQGFLNHGPEAMRPMVLNDIAEVIEMHESTISRVTTNKYMHTPQGLFELKYFFSSHVATDTGGECSSTAIRAIIKKLIAAENPQKPLSDSKIAKLLEEQGIKVARRTIAKYRESMSVPPSNERKRLV